MQSTAFASAKRKPIGYAFTPYPKAALKPAWKLPKLTGGATKLLNCLVALTSGRGRDQVAIEIKQVAAWAGIGNSTVSRNIPSLKSAGLITADLVPTKSGRRVYRFAVLTTAVTPKMTPPDPKMACQNEGHLTKTNLNKNDIHQQETASEATRNDDVFSKSISIPYAAGEPKREEAHASSADRGKGSGGAAPAVDQAEAIKPPSPAKADNKASLPPGSFQVPPAAIENAPAVSPPSERKGPATAPRTPSEASDRKPGASPLTETQAALAARLRHYAVSLRQADQLVRNYPIEVIGKALAGMIGRKDVINPAGWLVREIQAGGYSAPIGLQAEQTRAAVAQARAKDNAKAERERDRREEAARPIFDKIAALPAEERESLLRQAQARVSKFSAAAAADPNSPPVKAAMADLLAERENVPIQSALVTNGFLPHRGGWKDLRRAP